MSILKDGTILNRNQYKITKFIAQGGFGITYLAEEIGYFKQSGFGEEFVEARNPETVVIKELYYNDYCNRDEQTGLISISNVDKKTEFQKLVKNQIDEGKTIRGLKHRNIVRTRDIFHENETAYMVMDYIDSTDLEEMLKEKGFLDKETALKYIFQILDAVDYIHTKIDKKILHLDISPSNVLIDKSNDNAILIDFGSALSYDNVQNNITSTTSQIVTGRKKHYSPNEQGDIDNLKSFDATFDTYAVGATLFHLLTGEKPPLSSMVSTGREKIIPPSEFKKDASVTDYLDAVVIKSIAPFYNERYSSAEEFEKDLKKENDYQIQISKINQLIADKNVHEAFNKIKSAQQEFLKTSTLLKLEDDLKKEVELERKNKEYNILFKKGSDMASAEEFEMAIDYFSSAKELFPEKTEVDEKIKFCQEKINLKLEEKRQAEAAATQSLIDEKGETELLSTPIPPAPKPEVIGMPEATQLLETPKNPEVKREEPVKVGTPKVETQKQEEISAMIPKKKSKNGVIVAAVVGLVAIGGILYAMGIFSGNQNEVLNNNHIANDTIADNSEIIAEMPIEVTADSTVALNSTNPSVDWKSEFNDKFDDILNNEDAQSAAQSITQYKSLLSTIPADAASERTKIKKRIDGLNKTISSEKETTDWNTAKKTNTEKSYQNYINKYPGGKYVSDARNKIADFKKDTKKEDNKNKISDADMAQYNKDLNWAKNMVSVDGCEGCKANSTCQSQVSAKLKNALKYNPNGTEAKNLLNCVQ
ncbi:serine/threonine protein kinase [Moheibacter sediminis]|uniref:Serine/threonine protein kinase n=1 Tax=Moheibacter sediminis TaxID=1434700 RepID=A0A1W2B4M4_9FLAO|nr:serine/threonine-protein kinase [Moheibacter sediminis]SMC67927.1 Serine/threonine protein kinase [Moheibacter sediminis]